MIIKLSITIVVLRIVKLIHFQLELKIAHSQ